MSNLNRSATLQLIFPETEKIVQFCKGITGPMLARCPDAKRVKKCLDKLILDLDELPYTAMEKVVEIALKYLGLVPRKTLKAAAKRHAALEKAKEEICAICIEGTPDVRLKPCGHLYHLECVKEEFEHRQRCPLCKTIVTKARDLDTWLMIDLSPAETEGHASIRRRFRSHLGELTFNEVEFLERQLGNLRAMGLGLSAQMFLGLIEDVNAMRARGR